MIPSDIYAVLQWWSILLLLGVGFAPLTFLLFDKFFDKGYAFSKLLGMLITGYAVFVLSVIHLVPFSTLGIYLVFFILLIAQYFLLPKKWKVVYALKNFWLTFAIEELGFLAVLFIWAYIHSFAPDVHGLEKYMDFGFINSLLRSTYLPPKDMWFTPFYINYYYFGHLLTAMLTRMSGLSSALTFNLMLSSIVAFCFTQTFSIGANLYNALVKKERISKIKLIFSGLLTAALVTFGGNLHILYAFFKPYKTTDPVPFWQLQFDPSAFPNSYWYPNATRFIYNTIHEFPIYSWVVADLHGHVLDIPFVLLAIGLSLSLIFNHTQLDPDEEQKLDKTFQVHPLFLALTGLLLACMYMTNAWDGAIYLMLAAFVLAYVHGLKIPLYKKLYVEEEDETMSVVRKSATKASSKKLEEWKVVWGRDYLLSVLVIVAALFAFTTPYNIFFKPFVSGIGVICAPDFLTHIGKIGPFLFEANHCQKSYWWELATLYGFFYFFVGIFAIKLYRSKKYTPTDVFVVILILLSTILIIIPEFFYVKDIYPTYYRANTMFKLVFEAFIMLAISSGYIIMKTFTEMQFSGMRPVKRFAMVGYMFVTFLLVYLVMTYPYLAIKAYYGDLKLYHGLNGVTYLQTLYPNDYAGIAWLNKNVKGQPVVLEAQGDSYTDYGMVATNTGLPTVLGWTVHEWLWRGTYDIPAPRIAEVKTMYETTDLKTAQALLKKYNVKYVFLGTLEYQKYPALSEQKFQQLGKVVFQKGAAKIYQIN